jgi:hypothetical protein
MGEMQQKQLRQYLLTLKIVWRMWVKNRKSRCIRSNHIYLYQRITYYLQDLDYFQIFWSRGQGTALPILTLGHWIIDGQYSKFRWNQSHFTGQTFVFLPLHRWYVFEAGVDFDRKTRTNAIFRLVGPGHRGWSHNVDKELGNYDYLMGNDVCTTPFLCYSPAHNELLSPDWLSPSRRQGRYPELGRVDTTRRSTLYPIYVDFSQFFRLRERLAFDLMQSSISIASSCLSLWGLFTSGKWTLTNCDFRFGHAGRERTKNGFSQSVCIPFLGLGYTMLTLVQRSIGRESKRQIRTACNPKMNLLALSIRRLMSYVRMLKGEVGAVS